MQHTYIFHGTHTQYFKFIHAWWRDRNDHTIALSLTSKTPIHANYTPKENETIALVFYAQERRLEIITIFADALLDQGQTTLTLFLNDEASQEIGQPARAKWGKLKEHMESEGLLIAPLTGYQRKAEPEERGPHWRTQQNIKELRKLRAEAIRDKGSIPVKNIAMDMVGISRKTWRKHAPELYHRWDDKTYQPEPNDSGLADY